MAEKIITGFHAIEERLLSVKNSRTQKQTVNTNQFSLFYNSPGPRVKKILTLAHELGISTSLVDEKKLNSLASHLSENACEHRGVLLKITNDKETSCVHFDEWLSENKLKTSLSVLMLDSITDVHNVGAILRSADQFGCDLVIVSEVRSAHDFATNEIISRTSAGASSWVPFCTVTNLVRTAELLKVAGFWIYGFDARGENLRTLSFAEKSCFIMGSEGAGIAPLLKKQCDAIVSIPTCGKLDSLNVSVATGIALYELHARKFAK